MLTSFSWPQSSHQTWTYIADRTGIVAIANYALLWAFAGRNDIFLWLTGWNYATFNVFHRWIARVTTLEAIIHSIAFTVIILMGRPRILDDSYLDWLTGYCRWWQRWPCRSQQRGILVLWSNCELNSFYFASWCSRYRAI